MPIYKYWSQFTNVLIESEYSSIHYFSYKFDLNVTPMLFIIEDEDFGVLLECLQGMLLSLDMLFIC